MNNYKGNRLDRVIENDRLLISSDSVSLISFDLKRLLENYFNVEGNVKVKVELESDYYKIMIEAKAVGIKSFGIVK